MKRREETRRQGRIITNESESKKNQPATRIQPATATPPKDWEKQMDEMGKKLEDLTSKPPHIAMDPASSVAPAPYRDSGFNCY